MSLIALSFFAGVLTILAPCVLPLLPVILGASVEQGENKIRPYIIIASLGVSILIFSLLLKATTLFLGIDPIVWKLISGGIIIGFGIVILFPKIWETLSLKLGFQNKSDELLVKSSHKKGHVGSILVGMSLGPVFSSCSPTYGVILAVILPASFLFGFVNLIAYVIGLSIMLLLIAILGQKFIHKLQWASDPRGWFKKVLGIMFILVGLAIITGLDKQIETAIIESGFYNISEYEQNILDSIEK